MTDLKVLAIRAAIVFISVFVVYFVYYLIKRPPND
jgi:hypothetical protein